MTEPKTSPELMRALEVLANMPASERRPAVSDARLEWGPPPEGVRIGFEPPTPGELAYVFGVGTDGQLYLVYMQTSYEPVFALIPSPPAGLREVKPPRSGGWYVWPRPEGEP